MLVLGYVQQSKHSRFLGRCWIALIPRQRSKVTTAEPLKHHSSRHVTIHNSAAPIRLAVLLSPDFSAHHLRREKQVVSGRPLPTAGLHRNSKSDDLKLAPQDWRAISAKRQNKSGGRDSDLFEEWLKANPLPDSLLKEGSREGNIGLYDESTAAAEEFGAYHEIGSKEFRAGSGKMTGEESGDSEMLADRMLDRGQEVLKKLESPSFKVNDSSDGPAKRSGLKWGEIGPQQRREFSWEETGDVLYECLCDCDELVWSSKTRRLLEVNPSRGRQIEFIPPLILPPLSSCCTPREYWQSLHQRRGRQGNKQLIALLSSNAAALAIFNDGKLLLHKVLTAYTVRAQQGKSQMKYLRQGGPGRMTVGGAIRARETDRFFSRVCERLNEWCNEIQDCEVLFFSWTTRVWNEVYAADNSKTLVSRNDSRWCKAPCNVHEPRFREIQRVFYRLSHGAVCYRSNYEQQPFALIRKWCQAFHIAVYT